MSFLKGVFGKKDSKNPYVLLKEKALQTSAQELHLSQTTEMPKVFGMLMEQDLGPGSYTLVAFGEGSVSIYWSSGGGVIGAGEHEVVRNAAAKWLELAQQTYAKGNPGQGVSSPNVVLFVWRGFQGDRFIRSTPQELASPNNPLHEMYDAAQQVIAHIRHIEEARSEAAQKSVVENPNRLKSLQRTAAELKVKPSLEAPTIYGLTIEQDLGSLGVGTVAAFTQGTVSMFWGPRKYAFIDPQFAATHDAARAWLAIGQSSYKVGSLGLGGYDPNTVLFVWKGFEGDRFARATLEELGSPTHPLFALYNAAQELTTEIRELDAELQ
jgi:hypothetical protein